MTSKQTAKKNAAAAIHRIMDAARELLDAERVLLADENAPGADVPVRHPNTTADSSGEREAA